MGRQWESEQQHISQMEQTCMLYIIIYTDFDSKLSQLLILCSVSRVSYVMVWFFVRIFLCDYDEFCVLIAFSLFELLHCHEQLEKWKR